VSGRVATIENEAFWKIDGWVARGPNLEDMQKNLL